MAPKYVPPRVDATVCEPPIYLRDPQVQKVNTIDLLLLVGPRTVAMGEASVWRPIHRRKAGSAVCKDGEGVDGGITLCHQVEMGLTSSDPPPVLMVGRVNRGQRTYKVLRGTRAKGWSDGLVRLRWRHEHPFHVCIALGTGIDLLRTVGRGV
jgi:hypothetical protein